MWLHEVTTESDANEFIRINADLNRNNPNYIRPLDQDVREVFDPEKNKAFRLSSTKNIKPKVMKYR